MALSQAQIEELRKTTTAKREEIASAQELNKAKEKAKLSDSLSSKTTLTDEQKNAMSVDQLQGVANRATNQTLAQPEQPINDIMSMQQQLLDAQRQATVASLDKARNQSMLALQQEEKAVAPQYAQQRSQTRTTSELGAKGFSDFMAQRGLASSGGAALGETQRLGALQGALGGLQQQEQDVLANVGARRTGIEQGYQSDLASAEANIQAQAMQNAIAQAEADKVAQANATALERQQFMDTVGQFASNYQGQINTVLGDNDPANDWQADILGAARQQKIANQGLDQQGNALQTGIVYTVPQALEAYRLGIRTPEVMQALSQNTITPSYTGGGGGYVGGGTTSGGYTPEPVNTTPYTGGTAERVVQNVQNLNEALSRSRMTPQGKLDYVTSNYDQLIANPNYGKEAVDNVLQSLQPQETVAEVVETPQAIDISIYTKHTDKEGLTGGGVVIDESGFIAYLEALAKTKPEEAKEVARQFGYEAE